MKNTLLIAFNGGSYGTYLEWVLNSLITEEEIVPPFTKSGSSHSNHLGHHLGNLERFRRYLDSDSDFITARLHPKVHQNESLQANLECVLDNTSRVILLYPDRDHELMCVCNYMTKIWHGHEYDGAMAYINPDDIYQGYGIEPGTDLRTIPVWIRREHMSFNLFDSWHDQVEWYFPDHWCHDRAMVITTKELFYDFVGTLTRIENFWGSVKYNRNIQHMVPFHNTMIQLQPHLGKDALCAQILKSITAEIDENFEFGDLCLTSQAWIQYQLRLRSYELQCDGLDQFPTSTKELQDLIYKS
jgi:hypothetical protein